MDLLRIAQIGAHLLALLTMKLHSLVHAPLRFSDPPRSAESAETAVPINSHLAMLLWNVLRDSRRIIHYRAHRSYAPRGPFANGSRRARAPEPALASREASFRVSTPVLLHNKDPAATQRAKRLFPLRDVVVIRAVLALIVALERTCRDASLC